IYANDNGPIPHISYNTISDYESYAMRLGARMNVHDNVYSGSGIRGIVVLGDRVDRNTTWSNETPLCIVTGNITVAYPNYTSTATLTIEPGVEVKFNSGAGMYVGYRDDYGALFAQGTEEDPIIFTSNATTPGAGDWRGIYFRDYTNASASRLEHCVVEYAGSEDSSAIFLNSVNVPILNSVIQYSSTNGLYLSNSSSPIRNCIISNNSANGIFLAGSSNPAIGGEGYGNTISNSGSYAIYANDNGPIPHISYNTISDYGSYAMRLGARMNVHDNVYSGSGIRGMVILEDRIDQNTVWSNETPLYIVTGNITVAYPNYTSTATLTIEPGVEVKFNSGAGMYVGYRDDYGALFAQGTEEDPIIFTSNVTTPGAGDWRGIYFRDYTNDSASRLEHCIVEYAGAEHNANIYLENSKPTIQYNTIQNSSSAGVYVNSSGCNGVNIKCNNLKDNLYGIYTVNNARPNVNNNNFLRNQNYGVYNNGGSNSVNAENNWWGDPNGPNLTGDLVYGNMDYDPWLTEESGCVNSPPTNTPPYTPKTPTPSNGATRVPVMDEGTPISVTLSWVGGDPNPWDTLVYDIYLGTEEGSLTKVVDSHTSTSYDMPNLDQGITYYWKIVSRDDAGGETSGPVWHFTTLGLPPDLIINDITWIPETINVSQAVTFTATVQNNGSGPVVDSFNVDFRLDGTSIGTRQVTSVMASGETIQLTRTWTSTTGNHTIEVIADSAGVVTEDSDTNNSRSESLPNIIDPTPPQFNAAVPVDGSTVTSASTIQVTLFDQYGTVDDASVISSFSVVNSASEQIAGTVTENSDIFTFTPDNGPLADDTYTVSFVATDMSGNSQSYSFTFTVDGTAPGKPTITGGMITSGLIQARPFENRSNNTNITITGTRENNTSVWINNTLRIGLGSGDWSVDLVLNQGNNTIEILLEDAAGNRGLPEYVDILVDSVAPVVTGITPAHNSLINNIPESIVVNYTEATSGLSDANTSRSVKIDAVDVSGSWDISGSLLTFTPVSAFSDNIYTVYVQLVDQLG
ncbi:MAG: CARDB domain-containing protein, partial [Desulfobacteraceae bacterium]